MDLGVVEHAVGFGEVGVDQAAEVGVLEQRPAVSEHYRVVVDVGDPRLGVDPLGGLMCVLRGGQTGTAVEELIDAG
jgi:hypothetical protein